MNELQRINWAKKFWFTVFAMAILKYSYYGYSYYPIADDTTYSNSRLFRDVFHQYFLGGNLYTTRPAAGLLDPFFWAYFSSNLGIALLIITLLHCLTCFFICKVLEKSNLPTGMTFIIIFMLLPLGSEATYWISASTRLVVGLFFTALSLYLLCIYLEYTQKPVIQKILLFLFFITHLLSLGFYEQIISLSFFATWILVIVKWKYFKSKLIVILPITNYVFIVVWYAVFSNQGNMANRGQLVSEDYLNHFHKVTNAIYTVWKLGFEDLYKAGFIKGLNILLLERGIWFLMLSIGICAAVFYVTKDEKLNSDIKTNSLKLLLGIFLFVVPYAPFFPMELIWICNRNIFLSFIGLGLIVEALFNMLSFNRFIKVIRSAILSIAVFFFLIANVYELNYYRNVGLIDREIAQKIFSSQGISEYTSGKKDLILLNTETSYVESLSKRIGNCTGTDWSLTGQLYLQKSSLKLQYAHPVPHGWVLQLSKSLVEASVLLGMDSSRNIFPVVVSKKSGNTLFLTDSSGKGFGRIEFWGNGSMVFYTAE